MFRVCKILLVLTTFFAMVSAHFRFFDDYGRNKIKKLMTPEVEDDALFLTPYIENGEVRIGRELATVPPFIKNVKSYSGFLTVNKTTGSNLFFWLFQSQQGNWEQRPLVIYLEGGPGGSSLFGLLMQLGPISVTKNRKLKRRTYSWNRKCNLVFIDSPVGSGFSFTKVDAGYARGENDVARDLYEALVQLYKLFPPLQKNKLIITGESYAGKYIPAMAYRIYKTNQVSPFKINLAGLMIGNGFSDPVSMMHYGAYLYKLGLVDSRERKQLQSDEEEIRVDIKAGQFLEAKDAFFAEFADIFTVTGLRSVHDFVHDNIDDAVQWIQFLNDAKTRKAIHVGNYTFNSGEETYAHLYGDILRSVKPWVEELLAAEEFPVMYFSGQLDVIVAYPLSVEFYNSLVWPRAKEYYEAKRCQFLVGSEVAGYFKTAGTFTEVLVRNAGHMVAMAQPKWAYELFDRFLTNSSSFKCQ